MSNNDVAEYTSNTIVDEPHSGSSSPRNVYTVGRRQVLAGGASVLGLNVSSTPANGQQQSLATTASGNTTDFDNQLKSGIFTIHYYDGYSSDAHQIAQLLEYARNRVNEFYPHTYTHTVNIYLYREGEWNPSSFRTGQWFQSGEVQRARIRMVAPSEHPSEGELYYRKNVVHEYVHLPLAVDLRSGSQMLSVPRWFKEGLPQYIAVFETTQAIKDEYYTDRRWERVRQRIGEGHGFLLDTGMNVYQGGPHLLEFMVDEFGRTPIVQLPSVDAASFGEALKKRLDLNPIEFELRWLEWANEHHDANYQPSRYTADKTVSAAEYNDLNEQYNSLKEENDRLQEKVETLQEQNSELQNQLDDIADGSPTSESSSTDSATPHTTEGTAPSSNRTSTTTDGFGIVSGLGGLIGYLGYKRKDASSKNTN